MPGSVTVAIVCICGASHLERCLRALKDQRGAPDFDIVVAYDPEIRGLERVGEAFPDIRLVCNAGQRTPLELASRALKESGGDLVLLTEDHCVPDPGWVRTMVGARREGRAAVGGRVETTADASAVDWAFYFVDFFRYAEPVAEGPSPTLTVCNVAYSRRDLGSIADFWARLFHETAVNDALRARFGALWLVPGSRVTMSRRVSLRDAVYERYAFGRLFGCTRTEFCSPSRRLFYVAASPVLPALLMGRMAGKAIRSRRLALRFLRSFGPLALMVLAWSWGEWLGYATRRLPRSLIVAPEVRAIPPGVDPSDPAVRAGQP
jgi:hypothetical protein